MSELTPALSSEVHLARSLDQVSLKNAQAIRSEMALVILSLVSVPAHQVAMVKRSLGLCEGREQ